MNAIVELGVYNVGEASRLTPSPLQAHPLIKCRLFLELWTMQARGAADGIHRQAG
jgi:hypothetical protein